jgi:hypothetical protein
MGKRGGQKEGEKEREKEREQGEDIVVLLERETHTKQCDTDGEHVGTTTAPA